MIGQAYSPTGKKYNVIILAGGAGSRMGYASDYIPKALTRIGEKRAIDYIIEKYLNVAHKFIIGTSYHADLLESYVKGKYAQFNVEFSREPVEELNNNGTSTILCLDHADSRNGTIITFCDLLVVGNNEVIDDSILCATIETKGNIGTFRHTINKFDTIIHKEDEPILPDNNKFGVMGMFVIDDTPFLKETAYSCYYDITDLTDCIIEPYFIQKKEFEMNKCDTVYEFGNDTDLRKVRELWEQVGK
jgi:GTP:adenosylcobinamide-phosphate guanylyltransferase